MMHDPKTLHEAGWSHTADRSSLYRDPTTPGRRAKLAAALASTPKGARVLDYGCGRGEFTEYLAQLGFQATGVDLSEEAINFNRRDFPSLEWQPIFVDQPAPFDDGAFDAVWCSEVVEHVYDVNGIFAEFSRLLKPGGLLVLTTPYHGLLKNLLVAALGFDRHFDVEGQHIRFWTKRSFAKIGAKHRLIPELWDTVGRVPWLARSFFVVFRKSNGKAG